MVYFASGPYKKEYESLPVDRIYLIDFCFPYKYCKIHPGSKVTCIGMDCLESLDFLIKMGVKIDYFVCINEGISEGGARYIINSQMFISAAMPLFSPSYLHIMSPSYYKNLIYITLDLPFDKKLVPAYDPDWIDPSVFSDSFGKNADVYRMTKKSIEKKIHLNPRIEISIINDSIWNYIDKLDLIVLSLKQQGQGDFFAKKKKVVSIKDYSIPEILKYCNTNKIINIGLTPWAKGRYTSFIDYIQEYKGEFPKRISLFHLNKNDYADFRNL